MVRMSLRLVIATATNGGDACSLAIANERTKTLPPPPPPTKMVFMILTNVRKKSPPAGGHWRPPPQPPRSYSPASRHVGNRKWHGKILCMGVCRIIRHGVQITLKKYFRIPHLILFLFILSIPSTMTSVTSLHLMYFRKTCNYKP